MADEEKYRRDIAEGLKKAFEASKSSSEDVELGALRWIVFSDLHKGSRDGADDFRRCERAYNAALAYYLDREYTLAVLGDVEELWECSPREVLPQYARTLGLEKAFHTQGRYRRFWGNHDDLWRHPKEVSKHLDFPGIVVREGLRLRVRYRDGAPPGLIFLAHGHQGTAESDRFGAISRLFVRYVWRPLQRRLNLPSTTPSQDWELRQRHEVAMHAWAAAHPEHPVLITGHTHRPVFGDSVAPPKTARDRAEVQRELEAVLATQPVDRERAAMLRAEDEFIVAEERRVDAPAPIDQRCFFNTGCCSYGDGDITGLELADEDIRLVRWSCKEGRPERRELARDSLADVLAAAARGGSDPP